MRCGGNNDDMFTTQVSHLDGAGGADLPPGGGGGADRPELRLAAARAGDGDGGLKIYNPYCLAYPSRMQIVS